MGPPSACLQATLERALYPPLATRPLVPRSPKLPRHHDHDTVTRAPYRTSAKGRIAVPVDAQLVAAPACHTATAHAARDSSRQTSRQTSQRDRLAWRYPCRFPATHRSHLSPPPKTLLPPLASGAAHTGTPPSHPLMPAAVASSRTVRQDAGRPAAGSGQTLHTWQRAPAGGATPVSGWPRHAVASLIHSRHPYTS